MSSLNWALNNSSVVLPVVILILAALFARLLRFPFWLVLGVIGLPLVFFLVVPADSRLLLGYNPLFVLTGGWLGALGLLLGVWLSRKLINFLNPAAPKFSLAFTLGLFGVIGLISALVWVPESSAEGPDRPLLLGLLALGLLFALLAFSLSAVRFLRAGVLLVFWCSVSVVLGSKAFLNKLPSEISSKDISSTFASIENLLDSTEYRALVPTELVKRGMALSTLVPDGITDSLHDFSVYVNGILISRDRVKSGDGLTKKIDFPSELTRYPFVKLGLRLSPVSDDGQVRAKIATPAGTSLVKTYQEG